MLTPLAAIIVLFLPAALFGGEMTDVFEPVRAKSHVEQVRTDRMNYAVDMGGTVDMDNTTTRLYETFEIAFQNNVSLTIANTGNSIVKNPRVITNGRRRWWCMKELLDEILAGAADDQEKALLIWDFVRRHRHHDDPIFADDELHDPVKMLNVFGAGLCDDSGYVGCSLLHHAGLSMQKFGKTPSERTLHGHMMCEAILDSGYQFLDIDENAFYLDLENERPVSGDAIVRDHYLAKRDHTYGPLFKGWQIGEKAAALFGRDDGSTFRAVAGHRIDFDLRPGEQIEYRWDNCGKFASDDSKDKRNRRFWGTSRWIYEPSLTAERIAEDSHSSTGDEVVYEMKTPYAVCGGRVQARFRDASPPATRGVAVSLDGNTWQDVWTGSRTNTVECSVETDEAVQTKLGPAKYVYFVKVTPGAEALESLRIETDLMTSPHALPRLSVGRNEVEYTDDSDVREVTITHRWRESDNVTPPEPPAHPLSPADGATVAATTVPFQLADSAKAERYHIQVSRRPDMRLPYRPCFDVIIDGTEHEAPFAGMFNPDEPYYWRVRPRDHHGVWGVWSPVWKFHWQGPRVPIEVKHEIRGREIAISWRPNPSGPQPVRYEVYGSDERGFTPSKSRYEVQGLGTRPSNLVGTTTETQMTVVSADADGPGRNRAFYRVVAVDAGNVAGGPSDLIELPHPFIYSQPPQNAVVGESYQYQLKSLACLGDLQYRYAKPNYAFWEAEGHEFQLAEGPSWLTFDPQIGLLSGTPTQEDTGVHQVTVTCRRTYPRELKADDYRSSYFLKRDQRFQAEHRQEFGLIVR
jgi:hypothetical protein